ncbi:MAG: ProP effector [Burkholderiales bacterium]|jgi:ProP effector
MNTPSSAPKPAQSPNTSPVQSARALLKDFQEKFAVFRECMPLAIGIDKQLIARLPELDRKVLRIALGLHTNSSRYLRRMAKATVRQDLDGNNTDEITEAHRNHASEILRERAKKEAEQRKAQQQAAAAEEAARRHAEKLNQLAAKFSRDR